MSTTSEPAFRAYHWPRIANLETARKVARIAFWFTFFLASASGLFGTLAAVETPPTGTSKKWFLIAALFAVVAAGIWRFSRVAAISGFVLFVVADWSVSSQTNRYLDVLQDLFFLPVFIYGIQATFAYHRFKNAAPSILEPEPLVPK